MIKEPRYHNKVECVYAERSPFCGFTLVRPLCMFYERSHKVAQTTLGFFISLLLFPQVVGAESVVVPATQPAKIEKVEVEKKEVNPTAPDVDLSIITTWKDNNGNYYLYVSMRNKNTKQGYATIYLESYDFKGYLVSASTEQMYFQPYQEYYKQYRFSNPKPVTKWKLYVKE